MSATSTTEHATGIATETLRDVLDHVTTAPDLTAAERETLIRWSAGDEMLAVYSEEPALVRRLLLHPEADVTELRDAGGRRVHPEQYDGEQVTGIKATLPIGAVKLPAHSRDTNDHRKMISDSVLDHDPR